MNESIVRYILLGSPVPLARARYTKRCVYDAQKNIKLVQAINIQRQHGHKPIYAGPLKLTILFFMPIPQRLSAKKRATFIHLPHTGRPDLSNLIKFIEDVCSNGILYHDDAIIAQIESIKLYDLTPRTEFFLNRIGKLSYNGN